MSVEASKNIGIGEPIPTQRAESRFSGFLKRLFGVSAEPQRAQQPPTVVMQPTVMQPPLEKDEIERVIDDLPQRLQKIEDLARLRRAEQERSQPAQPVQNQQEEELQRINSLKEIITPSLLAAWVSRDDELQTGLAKVEEGLKTVSYLNIYGRLQRIQQECWGGQGEIWPILEFSTKDREESKTYGNEMSPGGVRHSNFRTIPGGVGSIFGYELRYSYLNLPNDSLLRTVIDQNIKLLYANQPYESSLAIYKTRRSLHIGRMNAAEFSGSKWIRRINGNFGDGLMDITIGELHQAGRTVEGQKDLKKRLMNLSEWGINIALWLYSPEEVQLLLDVVLAGLTQTYQTSSEDREFRNIYITPSEIEQQIRERRLYTRNAEGNFVSSSSLYRANSAGLSDLFANSERYANEDRQKFHENIERECQRLEWFRNLLDTISKENR